MFFFPPRTARRRPETKEIAAGAAVAGGNETILLVEDEAILREMARDILKDCGYHLLEASSRQGGAGRVAELRRQN